MKYKYKSCKHFIFFMRIKINVLRSNWNNTNANYFDMIAIESKNAFRLTFNCPNKFLIEYRNRIFLVSLVNYDDEWRWPIAAMQPTAHTLTHTTWILLSMNEINATIQPLHTCLPLSFSPVPRMLVNDNKFANCLLCDNSIDPIWIPWGWWCNWNYGPWSGHRNWLDDGWTMDNRLNDIKYWTHWIDDGDDGGWKLIWLEWIFGFGWMHFASNWIIAGN